MPHCPWPGISHRPLAPHVVGALAPPLPAWDSSPLCRAISPPSPGPWFSARCCASGVGGRALFDTPWDTVIQGRIWKMPRASQAGVPSSALGHCLTGHLGLNHCIHPCLILKLSPLLRVRGVLLRGASYSHPINTLVEPPHRGKLCPSKFHNHPQTLGNSGSLDPDQTSWLKPAATEVRSLLQKFCVRLSGLCSADQPR